MNHWYEKERKWLMSGFPEHLTLLTEDIIHQGYISFKPETRFRRKLISGETKFAVKGDGGDKRIELEWKIPDDHFNAIANNFTDIRTLVHKHYRTYEFQDGLIIQISKVDDEWFYLEIEFECENDMRKFVAPDWFGMEVTHQPIYKMASYAKRRQPMSDPDWLSKYDEVAKLRFE